MNKKTNKNIDFSKLQTYSESNIKPVKIYPEPERKTDFNLKSFDAHIDKHGFDFTLYRTVQCPCRDKDTHNPDYVCPYCSNMGTTEQEVQDIRGLIAQPSEKQEWSSMGIWEFGRAMLTVRRDVEISADDRIVYKKYLNEKKELIQLKSSLLRLRFNKVKAILSATIQNKEVYEELVELDKCINAGQSTAETCKRRNSLRKHGIKTLKSGVDYNLISRNGRSYLNYSKDILDNEAFISVLYQHYPEFVIMDLERDDVNADNIIVKHREIKRLDMISGQDTGEAPHPPNLGI